MTPASAPGTRPRRTTPVHGGNPRGEASRSFGRRAGRVHRHGPAVRRAVCGLRPRVSDRASHACFPEGGAAGILAIHGTVAPTEGPTVPRMTHASAPVTRPRRTTPVHGSGCHEGSSRSFGRHAGVVHRHGPAVRLPQESKCWVLVVDVCDATAVHRSDRRGKASRSFGRRAGRVHRHGPAVRLPQENKRWVCVEDVCGTTPVHGSSRRGQASRSFGRRAGRVHRHGPAVRLPQESKRWVLVEDVRGTTPVHGRDRRGKASRSIGRRAGIVHRHGPAVRLPQESKCRVCVEDVRGATSVHGGGCHGGWSRSFGRRAGIVHRWRSALRLPQENKRWDAGRSSTSPRGFGGRSRGDEREGAPAGAPRSGTTARRIR